MSKCNFLNKFSLLRQNVVIAKTTDKIDILDFYLKNSGSLSVQNDQIYTK